MDDIRSGKVKAAIFLFFIVVLIVGGYISMIMLTKDTKQDKKTSKVATKNNDEKKDIKINDTEDYIYFDNIVVKNEIRDIMYQDVVFNFDSYDAKTIATFLNSEREANEKTYKTIGEVELTEEEQENILFKDSDVYEATYNKYTRYFYKDYATIVNSVFEYNCNEGSKNTGVSAYVFDTRSGSLLSKSKLMEEFDITLDKIKEIVQEKLEKEQTIIEDVPQIDIVNTISSLDDDSSYALYVNKSGYLVINYFIKGIQENKLDVIILN